MRISYELANKLSSFKNQKTAFEKGSTYSLKYPGIDKEVATEDTMITIDDSREITVKDLLNLFVSVETEKVGEYTFMKKGVAPVLLGNFLAEEAKKQGTEEGFDLPTSITIDDRVSVGTTLDKVKELENSATILKGYKLHGIDTEQERIPQLWATERKDAKYNKKEDFKPRTKIVVTAS